jgi:hypothetical protein
MARSKCIKLLQHATADASQKPIALAGPYDPQFTSPPKLTTALTAALNAPRTTANVFADVAKLGISKFIDANTSPFHLGIALVDLSGSTRLAAPEYAGFNDTTIISSASIFKLAPIFAAHQLKFDVVAKLASAPATITDDNKKLAWAFGELRKEWKAKGLPASLAPNLEKIVVIDAGDAAFDKTFDAKMKSITAPKSSGTAAINEMNSGASHLIKRLNWTYIASTLLQTGITNETDGGLWVCGVGKDAKNHWICDADGKLVIPTKKNGTVQQLTAVSGAKYLSLMIQERLIAKQIAKDLKQVLANGDLGWLTGGMAEMNTPQPGGGASHLATINKDLADNLSSVSVFGKHGAFSRWAGEALAVERDSARGPLRYVVVAITDQQKSGIDYEDMLHFITRALIPALDGVIVTNNTP